MANTGVRIFKTLFRRFFCAHDWENNLTTDLRMWIRGVRVFRCKKCKLKVIKPADWIAKVNA